LNTRTVIRHTLVKDLNFGWVKEYAKLDKISDPDLVEPKGYVFVGASRQRLSLESMPSFSEIRDFSLQLGSEIGMDIIKEREDSRVLLLGPKGIDTDVRNISKQIVR
jgi:Fe-S oxidoreductases